MRNILFFAYTPFQTIVSLAIRYQYYQNDNAVIILADSVQGREKLKNNIEKNELFDYVLFGNIRKFFPKSNNRKLHELNRIRSAFDPYFIAADLSFPEMKVDVFISTEVNYYTESIYSYLRKRNKNIEIELMDEGYSSYTYYFKEAFKPTTRKNIMKQFLFRAPGAFTGRRYMAKEAKAIYYFAPELLCWDEIPYNIKPLTVKNDLLFHNMVNTLFDYGNLEKDGLQKEFEKPFLYFEESFFWSMSNNNDVEIIDHISEIIGKNNMAIKLHPRNEIHRFEVRGYKTNISYGIPWELVASNLPEDDKRVFLSFSSGAVLNYKFLCDKSFKTILLYKCIGDKYYHVEDSVKEWFEKFKEHYGDSVYIPSTVEELDSLLRDIIGGQ